MPAAAKSALQVVREGNPGHRPVREGLQLPPADLVEPDWRATFPASKGEQQGLNRRAREVARREWRRIVPVLQKSTQVAAVDAQILHDYCVIVARIDQCEREISTRGMLMRGTRGWQKNGATTIVSQYRAQLKTYIVQLGLSPAARAGITPQGDDDSEDDVFD